MTFGQNMTEKNTDFSEKTPENCISCTKMFTDWFCIIVQMIQKSQNFFGQNLGQTNRFRYDKIVYVREHKITFPKE